MTNQELVELKEASNVAWLRFRQEHKIPHTNAAYMVFRAGWAEGANWYANRMLERLNDSQQEG